MSSENDLEDLLRRNFENAFKNPKCEAFEVAISDVYIALTLRSDPEPSGWETTCATIVRKRRSQQVKRNPEEYKAELNGINDKFKIVRGYDPKEGTLGPSGELTETGARELHSDICRLAGMTADEIVKEWNKRSPEDPW